MRVVVCGMQWCDANLPAGSYFQEWTAFDHPQLGPVEIGGWKYKYVFQNPVRLCYALCMPGSLNSMPQP